MSRWPQSFFVNSIILKIGLIWYLNLVWLMLWLYLWCHIDPNNFAWTPLFYEFILLSLICRNISDIFGHAQICMNDCFFLITSSAKGVIFVFLCPIARKADEVEHPWCLSSRGDFLGVLRSNFLIFQSIQCSPTFEQGEAITALYLVTLYI